MGAGAATTEARWEPTWMTDGGAMYGVVRAAGWFDGALSRFLGLSGIAFHVIMNPQCWICSPHAFDAVTVHRQALARIGVLAEVYAAEHGSPVYELACRRAVDRIKGTIDHGVGVILYGVDVPEFGVVYGYDDDQSVFLADGCYRDAPDGSRPIPYDRVGQPPGRPELYYVIPLERTVYDPATAYRESLDYYVAHMEGRHSPILGCATGLAAYDNWLQALQSRRFDTDGLRDCSWYYHEAKQHVAAYVAYLAEAWNSRLGAAVPVFQAIARTYDGVLAAVGQTPDETIAFDTPVTAEQAEAQFPLLQEARRLEVEALALVKEGLR